MPDPNQRGKVLGEILSSAADEAEVLRLIRDGTLEPYLPGVSKMVGCGQGTKVHFEGDVAVHVAKVFTTLRKYAPSDPQVSVDHIDLIAVMVHDIEKPATRVEDLDGSVRFPGHEARAAD